jgi:hypothetical protein
MKALMLLFALSLCAAAQTLTGLPDHGVILAGDPDTPTLTNQSAKTILVARIFQRHASGKAEDAGVFAAPQAKNDGGLKPGESVITMKKDMGVRPGISDSPATSTELLLVIFMDGEVVGASYPKYEAQMEVEIQSLINAGNLARQGNWGQLQKMCVPIETASDDGSPGIHGRVAACQLVAVYNNQGEDEALKLASKLQQLPAKLWRAQQ